ncbi:MAG: hypothetical protein KY462_06605 [Actinobacteria bacterium]|nr:hypothetical protein [Actinomycetota bacterium]
MLSDAQLAQLGSAFGFTVVAFDRHNVVGQLGDVVLGLAGVSLAKRN